jgi:soluble lytic murein transglycosylase-like protein
MEWTDVWATQGVDVTAKKTVRRCLRYAPLVDRWNPDFQLDPALVFAVMAQESACLTNNDDGVSVGLMAVTPATWTTSRDRLKDPAVNIFWGMKILWLTLNNEEHNPDHDIRTALAAYNCGWVSLEAGKCFDFGGYAYADKVLHFWLPYVQGALVKP